MINLFVVLGVLHAVVWFCILGPNFRRHQKQLSPLCPYSQEHEKLPAVVALIPARNEEAALGFSLKSLFAQQHVPLSVIVANDQSTDSTPSILRHLQTKYPEKLTFFEVDELPEGWMGKCNALHQAYQRAPENAEWILFADADVLHGAQTVARALQHALNAEADLITFIPRMDCVGFWEHAALPVVHHTGMCFLQPGKINDPDSDKFAGIGAFTLVRRSRYDSIGGHEAIKGEVIDDMALAWKVKSAGCKQSLCYDYNAVHLRMYDSLGSLYRGFRKNMNVGAGSSFVGSLVGSFAFSLFYLIPLFMVIPALIVGASNFLVGIAMLILAGAYCWLTGVSLAKRMEPFFEFHPKLTALAYPLGALLLSWTMLVSGWEGAVMGKSNWRGRNLKRPKQNLRLIP
ncbi:MAG: glycosyltransferase [Sumerlaeia bacterium]